MKIVNIDKEWLNKKYVEEKVSSHKIANILKLSPTTVKKHLLKDNILCRSNSEAQHLRFNNHCSLSQEAIEWINGELFGDGSLHPTSVYSSGFEYSSKHLEYIEYVRDTLKGFGIEQSGKIRCSIKDNKKVAYYYRSRSYPELMPIRNQWYPNGKKIIPRDILLTPLVCRQHYIGDGSLQHSKKKSYKPLIVLYTCGFTIPDVEWLVKQIIKLGIKATRGVSKNRINISTYSTKDFLKYIGECPVGCYQYKWAY